MSPTETSPLVSVITVCWNAAQTIPRTIDSVQRQTYPNIEHVIVDGGSTDGTLEFVRSRLRPQDQLHSEPDEGISDALNKGVARTRGEFFQFLHADDAMPPDFIARAVECLVEGQAPFVYGDLVMEAGGREVFHHVGEPDYARIIPRRMPNLNHPTCVHRRRMFDAVGPFDLSLKCAMDYEWFLRAAQKGLYGQYVPGLQAFMSIEGVSNQRFRRTLKEVRAITIQHGRAPVVAWSEWGLRLAKSTVGRGVRAVGGDLYYKMRGWVNPAVKA